MTLRVGILGCGSFAHRHAGILTDLKNTGQEDVRFTAFSDHHEHNARAFAEKYAPDAAIFTDQNEMFNADRIDLLVVCLPPFAHTDEVEQCAKRGIHLLIEKPIALTSEHAWRMVEAAESAGIKTQVGFMYRFGDAVESFKRMHAEGRSGDVALMSARYFCNSLHSPWWRMRDKSGGQLFEQAIHMFDLLRYMAGDPVAVYSRQENLFHREVPDYTVEDVSATVVSFRHGGIGVVYATNNAIPGKWISDYRVVARNITADFTNSNTATFFHTNQPDSPAERIETAKDIHRAQMLDLLNAIKTGGETRTPIREGAKTLDLVAAATRAAESRTEIAL
jgi:predicted dehydrogenase